MRISHRIIEDTRTLDKHPVDVWTVSLMEPCRESLSVDEAARAARFKFDDDRVRWIRARSSLRRILARYALAEPLRLQFTYGEHGKPTLANWPRIQFNLSHAGDWAMVAITREVPVGVDVERMRPNLDMAPLLRRLGESDLPENRDELYQRWTLREAKSKAAGGALFDTPLAKIHAVPLSAPSNYSAAVALVGFTPDVNYCAAGNL